MLEIKEEQNNIDQATEILHSFQYVIDLMNRVHELINNGKYYAALRVSKLYCNIFKDFNDR